MPRGVIPWPKFGLNRVLVKGFVRAIGVLGFAIASFAFGLGLASGNAWGQHAAIPTLIVPEGLGLNIHFVDPLPGEMQKLAESGAGWVRMDLLWDWTEKQKNSYNFEAYDRLVQALDEYHLKAYFILDYSNPLYDQGQPPHSDEGREAFARWAVAATSRYAGKGYVWEIWNEPNSKKFWPPKANAKDYARLNLAVGKAFAEANLSETLVGPASSRFPYKFLKTCFEMGVLQYWSAVSIHPYRDWLLPETATRTFSRVRDLIARYAPEGRSYPILSGEWGYSTVQFRLNETKQAKYLARMFLNNLGQQLPISIWYDWKDDGDNPKEKEHHFGIVHQDFQQEKPAYRALKTLTEQLRGFRFLSGGLSADGQAYVYFWERDNEIRITAWTTSSKKIDIWIPNLTGEFEATDYLGEVRGVLKSTSQGLPVRLENAPLYLRHSPAH